MSSSAPDPSTAQSAWESEWSLIGPLASSARDVPEPWCAGFVHVADGLLPGKEPIQTGGVDCLQLIHHGNPCWVYEQVDGCAPHLEGVVEPGRVMFGSPTNAIEKCWTHWRGPISFVSVMLPPASLQRAARELPSAPEPFATDYVSTGLDDPFVASCMTRLAEEVVAGGPGGRVFAEQLLHALALHLTLTSAGAAPPAASPRGGLAPLVLRRVREHVEAHLAEAISLHDLAAVAGLSTFHFARAFRQTTGQPPAAYVRAVRLERARDLLRDPALLHCSIAEIAALVGYTTASAFSVTFRRAYDVTPRSLRSGT